MPVPNVGAAQIFVQPIRSEKNYRRVTSSSTYRSSCTLIHLLPLVFELKKQRMALRQRVMEKPYSATRKTLCRLLEPFPQPRPKLCGNAQPAALAWKPARFLLSRCQRLLICDDFW